MKTEPIHLATLIDLAQREMTTAQTIHELRKAYTDDFIRSALPYCIKGNRLAFESILGKEVIEPKMMLEVEHDENKDIMDGMK